VKLAITSLHYLLYYDALLQVPLTLFLGLELLIAYLQAYIFTFITCITIKDMAWLTLAQ